jgi:hypothetical protein
MDDGVKVTIELFTGFEIFNTRPYHNYETWSDGYRITGRHKDDHSVILRVEREDLDTAARKFSDLSELEPSEIPAWHLLKSTKPIKDPLDPTRSEGSD